MNLRVWWGAPSNWIQTYSSPNWITKSFAKKYAPWTPTTYYLFFPVDNYEFYWNIPLDKFMDKMRLAYQDFWDTNRLKQAEEKNMTATQVTTLASIVEKEVIHDKELPTVAGVYLNRLKINMPLQADPTLVFAMRDFDAKRVNNTHKEFDSPYNTYMHAGLPPGPKFVCPEKINSMCRAECRWQRTTFTFCANPDLSGYSIFSKTYDDQKKIAGQYRKGAK